MMTNYYVDYSKKENGDGLTPETATNNPTDILEILDAEGIAVIVHSNLPKLLMTTAE